MRTAKLISQNAYDIKKHFNGELKVLRKKGTRYQLENKLWYPESDLLIIDNTKPKEPKKDKTTAPDKTFLNLDINNINTNLKIGEYEKEIEALQKECQSWMNDRNKLKAENEQLKIDREEFNTIEKRVLELGKIIELNNIKYGSVKERLSMLILKNNDLRYSNFIKKIIIAGLTGYVLVDIIMSLWM